MHVYTSTAVASGVSPDQGRVVLGPKSVQTGRYGNVSARVYTSAAVVGGASPVKVAPGVGQIQSRRVCTVTSAFAYTPGRPQQVVRSRIKVAPNSCQIQSRRVRHSNISVRVYTGATSGWCVTGSRSHQTPGQIWRERVGTAASALVYIPAQPQRVVRHRIRVRWCATVSESRQTRVRFAPNG